MSNYTVYMLTSPEGKQYIGTTGRTLKERCEYGNGWRKNKELTADIKHFGWHNFKVEALRENVPPQYADFVEQFEVARHQTMKPHGYNASGGGRKGAHVFSSRTRPVTQLDLTTGQPIKAWASIAVASDMLGINQNHISEAASGKIKSAGGYGWADTDKVKN